MYTIHPFCQLRFYLYFVTNKWYIQLKCFRLSQINANIRKKYTLISTRLVTFNDNLSTITAKHFWDDFISYVPILFLENSYFYAKYSTCTKKWYQSRCCNENFSTLTCLMKNIGISKMIYYLTDCNCEAHQVLFGRQ